MKKGKLWAALWTPTDREGKLLKKEIKAHLQFLQERGVDGVIVGGTTGEFLYLDTAMRKDLLECVCSHKGSLQIIFNISHPTPKDAKDLAHFAKRFPIEGVILLPPLYYPILPQDLTEYFLAIAPLSEKPFYLYNFPERTGVKIDLETVEAVAARTPVAGIKQSGSDFGFMISLLDLAKRKPFAVYCGMDLLLPEAMELGAEGCMGGLVNIIPEVFREVLDAYHENRKEDLALLGARLKKLRKLLDKSPFPLNVAAFMEARGLAVGAPKMPLSEGTSTRYQNLIEDFRGYLDSK